MSKSWSSYEKDALIIESWRRHLTGESEPIQEIFGLGQKKKGKCPEGCCPCKDEVEWEEIDRDTFMEPIRTFQQINQKLGLNLDDGAIMSEFQQFLKDQHYNVEGLQEVEQRGEYGAIEHARKPKLGDLAAIAQKYPNLGKLFQAALKSDYKKSLLISFRDMGFEDATAWAQVPEEAPTGGGEEEAPTGGGEEEKPPGPTDQGAGLTDIGGGPGGEEAPTDGGAEETPAAAVDAISVYKGKGGAGLQSILDKSGIPGNVKSAVLKHIVTQLQKQGMEVQEIVNSGFPANLVEIAGPPSAEDQEEFASLGGSDASAEGTPATGTKPKSKNPQIAVYNHPAGKKFSLNQALQDAGYTGGDLGKLLDAIAQWGKAQGLKINEDIFASLRDEMLIESRLHRWQELVRG